MDVLGADVVFVHVAHHLLPLRLSQADAQRAECVKDDLNWGSVNLIKQYIYIYLIKEKNQNDGDQYCRYGYMMFESNIKSILIRIHNLDIFSLSRQS